MPARQAPVSDPPGRRKDHRRATTHRWTIFPPTFAPRWRPRRCGPARRKKLRPLRDHLPGRPPDPAPRMPGRVRASDPSSRGFRASAARPGREVPVPPPRRPRPAHPQALRVQTLHAAGPMAHRTNFSQNYRRKLPNQSDGRPAPFRRSSPGPHRRRRGAGSAA